MSEQTGKPRGLMLTCFTWKDSSVTNHMKRGAPAAHLSSEGSERGSSRSPSASAASTDRLMPGERGRGEKKERKVSVNIKV